MFNVHLLGYNIFTTQDKDKDNNVLGLSASLLAGEIASKDTNLLGPDVVAADPSML